MWLAAPFLSAHVAREIANEVSRSGLDLRLITALTSRAVASGSLSPEGIRQLLRAEFQVRSIPNLHAKTAIVDQSWAVVGSGNLTIAGADGGNVELGIELGAQQRRALVAEYERWWSHATPMGEADLGPFMNVWGTAPRSISTGAPQSVGTPLKPLGMTTQRTRRLAGIEPKSSSFWIKAMYHDKRANAGEWWRDLTWLSAVHSIRADGPIDRPSYGPGDMMLIYVKEPRVVPAIVEVLSEPRFDPEFVNKETGSLDGGRWGWVSEVEVVRAVSLAEGVRLESLGVSGRGLQNGHVRISSAQFAAAADLLG